MQRYTVYLCVETALHVSGGTSTHHQERIQLSTPSGICHTVTAICHYRGRVGTGLSVLWMAYATDLNKTEPKDEITYVAKGRSEEDVDFTDLPFINAGEGMASSPAVPRCTSQYATHSTLKPVPTLAPRERQIAGTA
jgi:hypothetical protein